MKMNNYLNLLKIAGIKTGVQLIISKECQSKAGVELRIENKNRKEESS